MFGEYPRLSQQRPFCLNRRELGEGEMRKTIKQTGTILARDGQGNRYTIIKYTSNAFKASVHFG
jgi:hypothetical protein